jgi:DNA-directed RNA polymerase subunit delta
MSKQEKKRMVIDYKNLTDEMLALLDEQYPTGFNGHYTKFPNSKGEIISAVRLETDDTIYLVKISAQMKQILTEAEMDEMIKPNEKELEEEESSDEEESEADSRNSDSEED